jgi:hypothetical protein
MFAGQEHPRLKEFADLYETLHLVGDVDEDGTVRGGTGSFEIWCSGGNEIKTAIFSLLK